MTFWTVILAALAIAGLVLLLLLIGLAFQALKTLNNLRIFSDRLEKVTNVAIWGALVSAWFKRKKSKD